MAEQLVQLVGAAMILVAFAAAQVGALDQRSYPYLSLNLAGAVALTWAAFVAAQWGFFVLETVWALVSGWGLLVRLRSG
jgi:hypothetical protein